MKQSKKGFTLIEIIVCIALISAISVSVILIKNKSTNTYLKIITKAAETYISIEKDENNNTYEYGLSNGSKGLVFNLKNLYDKGYIDEKIVTSLEKETGKKKEELKILASQFSSDDKDKCDTSTPIEFQFSWFNSKDPIYICPYGSDKKSLSSGDNYSDKFLEQLKSEEAIELNDYSSDLSINLTYQYSSEMSLYYSTTKTNGLHYEEKDSKKNYYYRGNVENNYLKIFNNSFRILNFNNDEIRIIQETGISELLKEYTYDNNLSLIKNLLEVESKYSIEPQDLYNPLLKDGEFIYEDGSDNYTKKSHIGLLTIDDTFKAGNPGIAKSYYCPNSIISLINSNRYHCIFTYYLNEYPTLLGNNNNNFNYILENYKTDSDLNVGGVSELGFGKNYSKWYYNNYIKNSVSGTIRPVLVLNPNNIIFKGKGLKTDPYVIFPKDFYNSCKSEFSAECLEVLGKI